MRDNQITPEDLTTAQPTHPGTYWFQSETASREMLVEVRLKDRKLIASWLNQDTPAADMKGRWRGPIPPSTGPHHPTAS